MKNSSRPTEQKIVITQKLNENTTLANGVTNLASNKADFSRVQKEIKNQLNGITWNEIETSSNGRVLTCEGTYPTEGGSTLELNHDRLRNLKSNLPQGFSINLEEAVLDHIN